MSEPSPYRDGMNLPRCPVFGTASLSCALVFTTLFGGCQGQPHPNSVAKPSAKKPSVTPAPNATQYTTRSDPEICSTSDPTAPQASDHRTFRMATGVDTSGDPVAQLCACWGTTLFCVSDRESLCFSRGRWYAMHEKQTIDGESCTCNGLRWESNRRVVHDVYIGPIGTKALSYLFRDAQVELEPEHRNDLAVIAASMKRNYGGRIAITPTDGRPADSRAKEIARDRAENIRDALIAEGVAADRLVIEEVTKGVQNKVELVPLDK